MSGHPAIRPSGRRVIAASDARALLVAALAAIVSAWGLWEGWWRAPPEAELKMSQKIFYFHAPLGIWIIVLTCVAAGAGIAYLARRRQAADLLSESAMEIVLVGSGIVLATGMLWAKPAWGEWFPWGEPRVTSMLVLFLIAVAYAALRSSVEEPDRRARFSAVLAIVGAMDALLAYFAIHLWNTTHPRVITPKGIGLQADMKRAFLVCVVGLGLWTWALVAARLRLARLRASVESLEHDAADLLENPS
jgi:heme exporter protein C